MQEMGNYNIGETVMKITDEEIFLHSNSIINDEEFEHIFNCTFNLRYSQKQYDLIEKYKYYFLSPNEKKEPTKIYCNNVVRNAFNNFFNTLLELFGGCEWFTGSDNNFFEIDYSKKQKAPDEFQKDIQKIKNLSSACSNSYKDYRKSVKQELEI